MCAHHDTRIQKTQLVVFPQTQKDAILAFATRQQVAKQLVNRDLCSSQRTRVLSVVIISYVKIVRFTKLIKQYINLIIIKQLLTVQ